MSDKEKLKPCEGYDLTRVNTPQDYQAVANSTESLEKIEDCMRSWIKQIEQVRDNLTFAFYMLFFVVHPPTHSPTCAAKSPNSFLLIGKWLPNTQKECEFHNISTCYVLMHGCCQVLVE